MKKIIFTVIVAVFVVGLSSCRNDFEFSQSTGNLGFSQDTIFLDTVFTTIGSSTRTFKVYNRSSDDIVIPRVALARGTESRYRLAVDGKPGQIFENVELLAKDSMYVFIETTLDINDFSAGDEFLYEDKIEFDSGANLQSVQLVTLVKDAIFLFSEREDEEIEERLPIGVDEEGNELSISGFFLEDSELNLTNEKPYVIYGFAAIPPNRTLTIDAGARLFFHANSGIIAANEASLKINGALSTTDAMENEVILEGDRLEPRFNDVAGQWFGIWLTAGSKNHELAYTTIKNASIGILMDSQSPSSIGATLKLSNSKVFNSSNVGLLATTANVVATNSIFHNAGQSAVVARLGGTYTFNNCTITNYWRLGSRRDPSLSISNTIPNSGLREPLVQALFTNCIIYGDRDIELVLTPVEGEVFNYNFENTLLKFDDRFNQLTTDPLYNFSNTDRYRDLVLNQSPLFESPNQNLLRIDNASGANGIGNPLTITVNDIVGKLRDATLPDAGAFESIDLEIN